LDTSQDLFREGKVLTLASQKELKDNRDEEEAGGPRLARFQWWGG
jgi:hypothetical protein